MTALQILPLVLSFAAMALSYYAVTRGQVFGLRPYLIFYNRDFDPKESTSWTIENAGNGPAINVIVGGDAGEAISPDAQAVVIPSIPKGHSARVGWVAKRNILVATYSDVLGNSYTTECVNNRITMYEFNRFPNLRGLPIFHYIGRGGKSYSVDVSQKTVAHEEASAQTLPVSPTPPR